MVRDPVVFLLDEPLSNLDAKLRSSMRSEITKLHKKLGTTFIYVTHDQIEAMTMGDRIVVMNKGYIQQVDTPQNLYEKPCNLFVAGFIGSPQMNFLDATVEKNSDGSFTGVYEDSRFPILVNRIRKNIDIASYVGKNVVIGIRPENLHDEPEFLENPDFAIIKADVDQVELMGSETYLYLVLGQKNIVARVSAHNRSRAGDKTKIAADCSKLHIFDADSGEALTGE
jgi:multiple sugar transport system ATP-binding protein